MTNHKTVLIACLLSVIAIVLMLRFDQLYPKDDGAFFLRYADNIVSGHGYTWNPGERNGIGASAPLWPPLIALVLAAGVAPFLAVKCLAVGVCAVAFILIFTASIWQWGIIPGMVMLGAMAGSGLIYGEAMGGLETPLTLLLLGAAFVAIARNVRNPYVTALLAAVLFIHKLDMIPWAFALIVTSRPALREKHTWLALFAASALVLFYFMVMKLATNHFFPISLSHKFEQSWNDYGRISRLWFIDTAFWHYGRWAVTIPAFLALPFYLWQRKAMAYFCAIGIGGQALAYSLFPPSEPFLWYACASIMGVNMLAAGVTTLLPRKLLPYATGVMLCASLCSTIGGEQIRALDLANAHYTEGDRARAGMWVAAHTPANFRVMTGFGNPAFYSHRYTYDFSGLNMAGRSDMPYIVSTYAPEILIICPWKTGIRAEKYLLATNDGKIMYYNYQIPATYKVVKSFDSALQSGYDDFYALILVRRDVENKLIP